MDGDVLFVCSRLSVKAGDGLRWTSEVWLEESKSSSVLEDALSMSLRVPLSFQRLIVGMRCCRRGTSFKPI